MPLEEIKTSIELINSDQNIDKQKLEKHCEQIGTIMQHLKDEIKVMEPMLQKLDNNQKELLLTKLSTQSQTLALTLLQLMS
jgi:MerR family transcriptional regulator, copper efflux regulator